MFDLWVQWKGSPAKRRGGKGSPRGGRRFLTLPTTPPSLVWPWRLWAHLSLLLCRRIRRRWSRRWVLGRLFSAGRWRTCCRRLRRKEGRSWNLLIGIRPLDSNASPALRPCVFLLPLLQTLLLSGISPIMQSSTKIRLKFQRVPKYALLVFNQMFAIIA